MSKLTVLAATAAAVLACTQAFTIYLLAEASQANHARMSAERVDFACVGRDGRLAVGNEFKECRPITWRAEPDFN